METDLQHVIEEIKNKYQDSEETRRAISLGLSAIVLGAGLFLCRTPVSSSGDLLRKALTDGDKTSSEPVCPEGTVQGPLETWSVDTDGDGKPDRRDSIQIGCVDKDTGIEVLP